MATNTTQTMTYANNITVTTGLSTCILPVNVTQTVQDLYNLYQSNISSLVSNVFYNISIINFNCTGDPKYFQQIITFTNKVSIRIQVAFASIYFDYISANSYLLNGFAIDPEEHLNLSSVTLNYSAKSDACSSADATQDSLCPRNSSTPVCFQPSSNPWIFNCSKIPTTSTISTLSTMGNNGILSPTMSTILNSWQTGLACGLGAFVLLIILLIVGYFIRRASRSKRIGLSLENLFDDSKSGRKSGIPQGQAFQRAAATLIKSKRTSNTNISWIHGTHDENYINLKPAGPYNQGTFIDHAKVHDPVFPLNIPLKQTTPVGGPLNTSTLKVYSTTVIPRPISGTSVNQLKSITDRLEEDTFDESDSISSDRSISPSSKKPSTPVSRQFVNMSLVDESLQDEDAWMSILAVANAELAVLNQLENEQNRIRTAM